MKRYPAGLHTALGGPHMCTEEEEDGRRKLRWTNLLNKEMAQEARDEEKLG